MERKNRLLLKKASLLWLIAVLLPLQIMAQQTGSVYGNVYDARNGQPLSGVIITITPSNTGAVTNAQGVFETGQLPVGHNALTASHLGYDITELSIQINEGVKRQIDIYMTPAPNILKPVIIKEKYVRDIPYIQHTILKEDIEMMAVRDIGDQLRMLPNVGGVKKGAVNIDPVIRGFKYSQITTLLDGAIAIEGGCPNRMDPTTSHVALDDMQEFHVLKGPFALRYGSVFGGVVNLVPVRPMPNETFRVNIKAVKAYESNWNGNREYINFSGGNKKFYFLVSGYNQKAGNYKDGNGKEYSSNYHKFGYKAAVGWRPLQNHEALLSFSNSMSKGVMFAALPMDDRTDDSKVVYFDYKIGKLTKTINSVDLKLYRSFVDHTMDNKNRSISDTVVAIANIIAEVTGLRFETGLNLLGGHLYAGIDQKTINKDGNRVKNMIGQNPNMLNVIPVITEPLWNDAEINNLGFFAEYKKRYKKIDIIAALRFDYNTAWSDTIKLFSLPEPGIPSSLIMDTTDTESKYYGFSISAGATYNFNELLSLNLAMGRGTRFPDMLERFIITLPVGYDNFEYMGNPHLKPEINNEVDLNLKFNHPSMGGVDFTVFYSYVQNYIMGKRIPPAIQKPLTKDVYGTKLFTNYDIATFKGFEFAYKSPEKFDFGVSVVASYTFGNVDPTVKPIRDTLQPPLQSVIGEVKIENDPAPEIPPFESTVNLHYKLWGNKLIPTFSYRFVAAQNNVSEAYFESSTPGFSLLSANLAYKHNQYLTISAGVNNILDTEYYEHLSRRIIGSKANFNEPGRVFYINMIVNL